MRSSKYPTQEFFKVNISQNYIMGHEPTNNFGHYRNDADFYFLEKSLRKRKADIYT